jgi:hypothetical protein
MAVIEESGMELGYDLSIPVILESHQIFHLKSINHLKHFFHLWLVKVFKMLSVHPLHFSDPWLAQTHRRIEGIVEQRPKPLVNACMLGLSIWIFFPSKLDLN